MTEPLRQSHYAAARGVLPSAIQQAVKRGLIRLTPEGLVDPDQADAVWYRRHLQRQDARRSEAEVEARREQALINSTAAKIVLTGRKAAQMRDGLIERDPEQAEIGAATVEAGEELACAQLEADILKAIGDDLGDLAAEALRVTQ